MARACLLAMASTGFCTQPFSSKKWGQLEPEQGSCAAEPSTHGAHRAQRLQTYRSTQEWGCGLTAPFCLYRTHSCSAATFSSVQHPTGRRVTCSCRPRPLEVETPRAVGCMMPGAGCLFRSPPPQCPFPTLGWQPAGPWAHLQPGKWRQESG